MFTGIIESLGQVVSTKVESGNLRLRLSCPFIAELKVDQSVAHNGVCLTVEKLDAGFYEVVAIKETLQKTNLGKLNPGDAVNLERCLRLGDRLDGHLVQGHVDDTATCIDKTDEQGSWIFRFRIRPESSLMLVPKGSVSVNGVSLTVVEAGDDFFSVAIIPYTFQNTGFQHLKKGDVVNLEFDVISKYVQRMMQVREG